jgi:SAM-dependent methyltransferase
MQALPWGNETFDVVTGFRGIWGTTPEAVDEAHRVLVPGGRLAIAVWGNVGKSPGAWMMAPFLWATDEKVQHQETCARGLASTGPAYEAIQSIGEEEFITRAIELAARHMRDGLPLRGQIELFGYLGTKR